MQVFGTYESFCFLKLRIVEFETFGYLQNVMPKGIITNLDLGKV